MSGRAKRDPAQELRDLLREVNGTIKDGRALLRDLERQRALAVAEMADTVNAAIGDFNEHIQKEMNRESRDLNAAVRNAQDHIIRQLTFSRLDLDPENQCMYVRWDGVPFDEDPAPPDRGKTGPSAT